MIDAPMSLPTVPRYGEGSLADLACSLLASLGVGGEPNPLELPGTGRACLLIVDGLGWELLRDHPAAAPFLSELAVTGRPLTAGFPATTVTSLTSLGTGLAPGMHGMLGYQVAVPGAGMLLNGLRWDSRIDPVAWQPRPTIYERAAAAGVGAYRVAASALQKTGFSEAAMRGADYRVADSLGALVAQSAVALKESDRALVMTYYGKLDSTGHRASSFGLRGSVTATMPGEGEIEYDGITPAGATYFGGRGLTKSTDSGFLVRVSSKGKIDTKFSQRSQRSLKRLSGVPGNEVRVTAAVVGRKGSIELFGSAGSIGGFELRLNQNGTLRRGWAKQGLGLLPFSIVAAVQGREGSMMALTGEEAAPPRLLRILSNGKLDPVFGKTGETFPGATSETGFSLFPAGIGRVGVTDLDLRECRQVCESTPKIYRYLEGR